MSTPWYWPDPAAPAPDRHSGALADFTAMYGAGGQLAQLLTQAYGFPGLTPEQAMDKVRTLLAEGGRIGGGNTGTMSRTVTAAVTAAGTASHLAAAGRQITAAILADGTTTLPGGLLDESGGALLAEDDSPILAEDGT